MMIARRAQFADLLNDMGLWTRAAEVGVAEGYFSFDLVDRWPGVCYQIDPWARQDTPGYSWHGETDQEARYQRILERSRLPQYRHRAIPVRATSIEAAGRFEDEFFDFIYIDAIHTAEASAQDIELWYPKVKRGGILAGHDYLSGVFQGQDYGVKDSVDAFAMRQGMKVRVVPEEWPSWWVQKP